MNNKPEIIVIDEIEKTMNPEQENKYTAQLAKSHYGTWSASELLHLMRPEVEKILANHGRKQPPSQSHRAQRLLEGLDAMIDTMAKEKKPIKEMSVFMRERRTIRDFLAVHRTVWILEGKPI